MCVTLLPVLGFLLDLDVQSLKKTNIGGPTFESNKMFFLNRAAILFVVQINPNRNDIKNECLSSTELSSYLGHQ